VIPEIQIRVTEDLFTAVIRIPSILIKEVSGMTLGDFCYDMSGALYNLSAWCDFDLNTTAYTVIMNGSIVSILQMYVLIKKIFTKPL
jgi:hypothetical protein